MTRWLLIAALMCGCVRRDHVVPQPTHDPSAHYVLTGGVVVGLGARDIEVEGETIIAVRNPTGTTLRTIDVTDKFIVPAGIDSHVHLAYLPIAEIIAEGGIAAAVDLGAPREFLDEPPTDVELRLAGPMVTGTAGYPTRSWGADGYGIECKDAEEAAAAVSDLQAAGATLIKIPFIGLNDLSKEAAAAAIGRAHDLELKVIVHALDEQAVLLAAKLDADVLAHTPTALLSADAVRAWKDKTVISTLSAFGRSEQTIANLRVLEGAGATVLYGTDLGNTQIRGIDRYEIELLTEAGLSGEAIVESMTAAPAAFWGFEKLGSIQTGNTASFLVLSKNPSGVPTELANPEMVFIRGRRL